jgi:succinate dehydrogenase/fumarate reductase cytochrome b subunit
MALNEKRSLFSIHGMTGFLIATIVLVVVVLSLAYLAYETQVANATNYYDVKDMNSVKKMGSDRADHIIDVK